MADVAVAAWAGVVSVAASRAPASRGTATRFIEVPTQEGAMFPHGPASAFFSTGVVVGNKVAGCCKSLTDEHAE
ncbi:hypothetical protein GCM10009741_71270 [Kribbella lupini]|uniref:Secreted protein n=1 Tax=Kribbella lupini TaxID=291602 RepID=A0ABP4NA60_9ACTN